MDVERKQDVHFLLEFKMKTIRWSCQTELILLAAGQSPLLKMLLLLIAIRHHRVCPLQQCQVY